MPTYGFICRRDHEFDLVLPSAEYNSWQRCPTCGKWAIRKISAPRFWRKQDINYTSPVDGRPITSQAARNEDLARHNCQPYDPEMKTDYNRRIVDAFSALEKAVDNTVEHAFDVMPSAKREKLASELASGVTAEPLRRTVGKPLKVATVR